MDEGGRGEREREGGRKKPDFNKCLFCIEFVYFDNYIGNINV